MVQLTLFGGSFTPCLAGRVLDVFFLGKRCRNPPVAQVKHGYFIFVLAAPDDEAIIHCNRPPGLYPGTIQLYFAALDGVTRERAGLKEPRGPEPFVDADFFAHLLIYHKCVYAADETGRILQRSAFRQQSLLEQHQ